MSVTRPFKARAHLLKLLGDELIGDDRLAIFELVKNAYDADATEVDVTLNLNSSPQTIVIMDIDGHGMDKETILNKWMEIGTDSKRKENRKRSPKFKRMPLGEKGVGRLAVHKLGSKMILNTRSAGHSEYRIIIDWPNLIDGSEYIEDTKVNVETLRKPEYFQNNRTGTRIEIQNLNNTNWARGDIRRLKRLLTSLISPFDSISDFNVNLKVPGKEKDLIDILGADDILNRAIWKYSFHIDKQANFSYSYEFNPPSIFKPLKPNKHEKKSIELELAPPTKSESSTRSDKSKDRILLSSDDLLGIGPMSGQFYIFLRDQKVLNALGGYQDMRLYLDEQTGVRIYRDGIRVFNYGEPNDDWLGLNADRINRPGNKIGTNMVIGGISLNLEKSSDLAEKTNREGFDENRSYQRFRWIVSSAISKFYLLHSEDRGAIKNYIEGLGSKVKPDPSIRFTQTVTDLKDGLVKHGLSKELGGMVNQIEADYLQMREVTLSTGIAGINLAVIFHEVERGVEDLNHAIKSNAKMENLLKMSEHLSNLLEGFAPLLRRNEQKKFKISTLAKKIIGLCEHRFEHHKVTISCPILTGETPDFEVMGPFGLLQAALNNLIDNSIHWTRYQSEKIGGKHRPAVKILTVTDWFKEGPALVVADNGPGFTIPPEEAIQPFITTRSGGMGVGLYYSNMVMDTIGGRLLITSGDELELETAYSGAAVAMIFKGVK